VFDIIDTSKGKETSMKLVKINDSLTVNADMVGYISTVYSQDCSNKELMRLMTLDELKSLGFPVRRKDVFHESSWGKAVNAVKKNPTKCIISHSCISGYTMLEDGELTLVTEYLKYNESENHIEEIKAKNPENIIVAYDLELSIPCGGINNSHVSIRITPKEMQHFLESVEK